MIAKVKDWKSSHGKQFMVLERDCGMKNCEGQDYIRKVQALNFHLPAQLQIGQQIWCFDDTFKGLRARIIAIVCRFYEDQVHLNLDVITYVGENADKEHDDADWNRTNMKIEMDDLKDNLFFVGLFEKFMAEALEREKELK